MKICTIKVYKEPLFIMFISKEFLIKKRGEAGHHYQVITYRSLVVASRNYTGVKVGMLPGDVPLLAPELL